MSARHSKTCPRGSAIRGDTGHGATALQPRPEAPGLPQSRMKWCKPSFCSFDGQGMMRYLNQRVSSQRVSSAAPLGGRWPVKAWMSGNVAGTGTFRCTDCDYPVSLDAVDELPTCPNCGGKEFVRASLFTTAQASIVDASPEAEDQAWLEELRDNLDEPGQYIAYRSADGDV